MPPSPEPLPERVMAAVAERLATMTAGADYWFTPSLVTRSLLEIDQYMTELKIGPVLGVMRTSASTFLRNAQPARFAYEFRFSTWGCVLGQDDRTPGAVTAGTKLNRLVADVRTCLVIGWDWSLNGAVKDLKPDGTVDTDNGRLEPMGWIVQDWVAIAAERYS